MGSTTPCASSPSSSMVVGEHHRDLPPPVVPCHVQARHQLPPCELRPFPSFPSQFGCRSTLPFDTTTLQPCRCARHGWTAHGLPLGRFRTSLVVPSACPSTATLLPIRTRPRPAAPWP